MLHDALSHNMLLFTSLVPQGQQVLSPSAVLDLLLHNRATRGFSNVDTLVHTLFDSGISLAIRAVYESGWRQYQKFCTQYHIAPLPVNETSQSAFAAHLSQSVSPRTIQSCLCAVRLYHIRAGQLEPTFNSSPRLKYIRVSGWYSA
jgi:hypothetical protein